MNPDTHPDPLARAREVAPDLHLPSLRGSERLAAWLEPDPARPTRDRFGLLLPDGDELLRTAEGTAEDAGEGLTLVHGPLSATNARVLCAHFSDLVPRPLGLETSAGFGDRLGVATPGHVRALRDADPHERIRPIFAQQSIREMTRTGRSPQDVMLDATWGAFASGWTLAAGADADHLKTDDDVRRCVRAGFSLFTFDPGEHVDDEAAHATEGELEAKLSVLPWDTLRIARGELRRTYLSRTFDADGVPVRFDDATLARACAKYGAALAHAVRLHATLAAGGASFEIELSVDETGTPTTVEEHAFLALELKRLGVPVVSLAPRFVGRFEKGVDFRGDLDELARTLDAHARVARAFGPYKLSLHSGSDKFSVYPLIAEATDGLVHLKTAGTSYLEALRVAARFDPELFRDVLALAFDRFETDRASYLIGAEPSRVPAPEALEDSELASLLDDDDARQMLHVTYGSALDAYRPRLLETLETHREAHEMGLAHHFERHLKPFVPSARVGGVV